MTIWFDMDGTIADLYGVNGWLDDIIAERTRPYDEARTLVNMNLLARLLHRAQKNGYKIGIISWTAKNGRPAYNLAVEMAKRAWLMKHLPSVKWDEIRIVRYGTNKWETCKNGILFDDEECNRNNWENDAAYTPEKIIETLKMLLTNAA